MTINTFQSGLQSFFVGSSLNLKMMTCGLTHLLRKSSGGHGWLRPPPLSKWSLSLYRLFNVFMDGGCNLLASEALSQVQWSLWDLAVCYFLEWAFLPIKGNPSDRHTLFKDSLPPTHFVCVCVAFVVWGWPKKGDGKYVLDVILLEKMCPPILTSLLFLSLDFFLEGKSRNMYMHHTNNSLVKLCVWFLFDHHV